MAELGLFNAESRLQDMLSRRKQQMQQQRQQMSQLFGGAANTKRGAAANATAAQVGSGFGQGLARGLFGEGEQIEQAREDVETEQRLQDMLANLDRTNPESLRAASKVAIKSGLVNTGNELAGRANKIEQLASQSRATQDLLESAGASEEVRNAARLGAIDADKALSTTNDMSDRAIESQYNSIFRATEQAVREEVDPVKSPIKYNKLMSERLSQSNNPLAVQEARKFREQATEYVIEAAENKAKDNDTTFSSPKGTEAKFARGFLTTQMERDERIAKIDEEELSFASVELASRAKDLQEKENIPYNQAVSRAYEGMFNDGTFDFEKGEKWYNFDKFKYVPVNEIRQEGVSPASESVPNTVRRKMPDGRTALFNADTKEFVGYE